MIGRHTYAPLIYSGDDALAAQDDAARKAKVCLSQLDDLGKMLERFDHQWRSDDVLTLKAVSKLLADAEQLAESLS